MIPSHRFSALLLCASVVSSAGVAETLNEAIVRAVASLPEVRAARANRNAIEESVTQARGAWFPTLDASLGWGRETSNNASTRVTGSNVTLDRREAEVNLSQLLFDGGAAAGQIRRFALKAQSAGDLLSNAAETAAARAAQAYLDVMRLRDLIILAEQNEKRHQETLAQVSRLAEVGQGRRVDAQQAEARLALAQASLTQLRSQLAQANAAYQHVTGQAPDKLEAVDGLPSKLPASLQDAIARAQEAHPAIRAAHQEWLAAQADRDTARERKNSPRLTLDLGQSVNRDLDGIRGVNADRYAMLRLRFNLFRGGTDTARVREAEARIDESLATLARVRNDSERDLRQAWDTLVQDRLRLPQLRQYASVSAQVVSAYRSQFTLAQRTLLDVLNSENELYNARSSEQSGQYAVTLGEIRVLSAMGELLRAMNVNLEAPQSARPATAPAPASKTPGSDTQEAVPQHRSRISGPHEGTRVKYGQGLQASAP